MPHRHLILLVVFASTGPALASDWQRVMPTSSRATGEWDRESVVLSGGLARVWTRALYPEPFTDPATKMKVGKIVTLREIDCTKRVARVITSKWYGSVDSSIGVENQVLSREPKPIEPDTYDDALRRHVCPGR